MWTLRDLFHFFGAMDQDTEGYRQKKLEQLFPNPGYNDSQPMPFMDRMFKQFPELMYHLNKKPNRGDTATFNPTQQQLYDLTNMGESPYKGNL